MITTSSKLQAEISKLCRSISLLSILSWPLLVANRVEPRSIASSLLGMEAIFIFEEVFEMIKITLKDGAVRETSADTVLILSKKSATA